MIAPGHTPYFPAIDGLRALAVIAVILFHCHESLLPGGYSGVSVFFVISGYLVSAACAQRGQGTFSDFIGGFYARRMLRILPALVVCLTLASLASALFIPHNWLNWGASKTALMAYAGLGNFALVEQENDYFSPRAEHNPFTHTWSLGVEEQFYFLFPLLFYFWLRASRRGSPGLWAWLFPSLSLLSLAFCVSETTTAPERAFYLLPARFWEIGAGVTLFQWRNRVSGVFRRELTTAALSTLGLGLVVSGFVLSRRAAGAFPWAAIPVAGALLLIASVTSPGGGGPVGRVLQSRALVAIGRRSYSLYLWHWPVLVLFRWTVGLASPAAILGAISLSALMALTSYHLVETRFGKGSSWQRLSPAKITLGGAFAAIAFAIVGGGIWKYQARLSLSVNEKNFALVESGRSRHSTRPEPDGPSPWRRRRLFVVGDSHAAAYKYIFQRLAEEERVEFTIYSRGGCAVAGLVGRPTDRCARLSRQTIDTVVEQSRPGDVVFLASRRMPRLSGHTAPATRAELDAWLNKRKDPRIDGELRREAKEVIERFGAAGLRVIIDGPKPVMATQAYRCLDWYNSTNPVCSPGTSVGKDFLEILAEPIRASLSRLQAEHPELVVWEPMSRLCPGEICSLFGPNGKPLFMDSDHLTVHAAQLLYPDFKALLPRRTVTVSSARP